MDEFHSVTARRIEQFTQYLLLMRKRLDNLTKGNCFIIFEDKRPDADSDAKDLGAAKSVPVGILIQDGSGTDVLDDFSTTAFTELPDEGWRESELAGRFIQFSFNPTFFDMDIPNTTLYLIEAAKVLRDRPGVFYVKDRPRFSYPEEKVQQFDPLRKAFVYGDEKTAAEDMAYIWFHLWKYPVDSRFYVTASSFHDGVTWERGAPIE